MNVTINRYKVLIFIFLFGVIGCVRFQTTKPLIHPNQLNFSPIKFTPPKPERHVLKNGMVVYLLPDHEIPLISIYALIRCGSVYEADDKVGLAGICGQVMRTGGTKLFEPEEINKKLEYVAASVESSIGRESGSVNLSVLKKDFNLGMDMFTQILRYPKFRQDKIDLEVSKSIESIRRRNDDPMDIASREFKKLIYKNNPRGRVPSIAGMKTIKREELINFHEKYFFPNNIILGVSGDFISSEILNTLSKYLGDWAYREDKILPAPIPEANNQRCVVYAKRPLPQSTIINGYLTLPQTHPDYYSFKILNFIIGGGGFNSYLMRDIRSNRGLAYSVGSFYTAEPEYGVFGTYCLTKSSTTAQVIDLMNNIIDNIKNNGVTLEELKWAKESIINKFIFSFESSNALVREYIGLEYDKYPQDYLETYCSHIKDVTLSDICHVANTYLHPQNSSFIVVGNNEDFDEPLIKYGKIIEADLSIF